MSLLRPGGWFLALCAFEAIDYRTRKEGVTMNLFELLTILVVIALGYLCGKYFGVNYGLIG